MIKCAKEMLFLFYSIFIHWLSLLDSHNCHTYMDWKTEKNRSDKIIRVSCFFFFRFVFDEYKTHYFVDLKDEQIFLSEKN